MVKEINNAKPIKNNLSIIFLGIYILTGYICQEGLLPTVINSLALYAFLGISFLFFCSNITKLKIPNFTLWYVGVFVLSAFSLLYAKHIVTSALYVMFVALVLSFCFIVTITDFNIIDIVAKIYIWSSVLMSFMLLVTDQLIVDVEESERLGSNIGLNPNAFSSAVLVSAIINAWYMVYRCKNRIRWLYALALVAQIFTLSLSGGRKSLVIILVCITFFLLFYSKQKYIPFVRNFIICVIIVGVVVYAIMNIPVLYDTIGHRFEGFFGGFMNGVNNGSNSDRIRRRLIEVGLEGWFESPIFGHGVDTAKYLNLTKVGYFYYSHNNYVEILYDLGLVGFVAYYSLHVYLFYKLFKMSSEFKIYKLLGLGLLFQIFIDDIGEISYYSTHHIIILAIVFAIVKITSENKKDDINEQNKNRNSFIKKQS